ncbi:peroxisomal membrane protein 11A-like [Scleropages formosus]|uniref:Peroxisomal biogenesis factor 11 alpha n=1 Tax=Scleropages formosus TaxID=113540 RepID=A0A0P7U6C4_SCLFO|nr:peroxisomal membrane protein 11A-like [Scleropages formosus]KPP65343.1 peroxisomal membrane protein 11A-like [Scleropages formosus]
MDSYIKLVNQSQGRDRVFRATQYACALLRHLLRNHAARREVLEKLRRVESNMSSGRKLFRLGNTVSSISAVKQTMHLSDPMLQLCLTSTHLIRALYFVCDNILWAQSVGLLHSINKECWSRAASRCYLISLVLSLARDVYFFAQVTAWAAQMMEHQKKPLQPKSKAGEAACYPLLGSCIPALIYKGLKNNPPLILDALKNICDLFIPLDTLGIYETSPGMVGLCGLLSSFIGILTLLKPNLKLTP